MVVNSFANNEGRIDAAVARKISRFVNFCNSFSIPIVTIVDSLGVAINNVTAKFNFIQSMFSSLGVGLGFLLAMVLFAGVRSRIENCPAPECMKGLPVTLVAASIVSLAFFGFGGIVENLLG